MPTYTYKCPYGHVTETFESMLSPSIQLCPQCAEEGHEEYMQRQIGLGGAVLWKGGAPTPRFSKR